MSDTKSDRGALIREMAWCGNSYYHDEYPQNVFDERCGACHRMEARMQQLAALIDAEVREQCAQIFEREVRKPVLAEDIAAAIRARRQEG